MHKTLIILFITSISISIDCHAHGAHEKSIVEYIWVNIIYFIIGLNLVIALVIALFLLIAKLTLQLHMKIFQKKE